MKKILLSTSMALALIGWSACSQQAQKTELKTTTEKVSYSLGLDVGGNLKALETEVDLDALIQGIRDTLSGKKPLLTRAQVNEVMREFSRTMSANKDAKSKAKGETNLSEGKKFLEENGKKEGVVTTASGLQYKVLTEGTGKTPKATDKVTVHYRGTLIDGTEFDSSYGRGEPTSFPLNRVISGWTEGLQLMNIGSKYEFYVPSDLGYGSRGAGAQIGPNATLIFQVELLEIN